MIKQTHYFHKNMLQDVHEIALRMEVSDSDIVRMAVKEYCKKHKGD
jgi:hypothetical protein